MPTAINKPVRIFQDARNDGRAEKRSKPIPWVEVNDDERERRKKNSLKRNGPMVNGNDHSQNGRQHKKARLSYGNPSNDQGTAFGYTNGREANHAGPSSAPLNPAAQAIQEQRKQLPIYLGAFRPFTFSFSTYLRVQAEMLSSRRLRGMM